MQKSAWMISALLLTTACDTSRKDSIKAMNVGAKALGNRQYSEAITHFEKAKTLDPSNELAWFQLGEAQRGKGDIRAAADAYQKAAQLNPKSPLYTLRLGSASYEKVKATAREAQKLKPSDPLDLASLTFDDAEQWLTQAIKLEPNQWRAHWLLGAIYRDSGRYAEAAGSFTKSILANPFEAAPYVDLGQLYRKWDYSDEAIAVAEQGAALVPNATDGANIWYVAGMAYSDKGDWDKAIDAFSSAIKAKADHHDARFQRGLAYFRKKNYKSAKPDLEAFVKSGSSSKDFIKAEANKMIQEIQMKTMAAGGSI